MANVIIYVTLRLGAAPGGETQPQVLQTYVEQTRVAPRVRTPHGRRDGSSPSSPQRRGGFPFFIKTCSSCGRTANTLSPVMSDAPSALPEELALATVPLLHLTLRESRVGGSQRAGPTVQTGTGVKSLNTSTPVPRLARLKPALTKWCRRPSRPHCRLRLSSSGSLTRLPHWRAIWSNDTFVGTSYYSVDY